MFMVEFISLLSAVTLFFLQYTRAYATVRLASAAAMNVHAAYECC